MSDNSPLNDATLSKSFTDISTKPLQAVTKTFKIHISSLPNDNLDLSVQKSITVFSNFT